MKRRTLMTGLTSATALGLTAGYSLTSANADTAALSFPKDDYTVETKTVTTSDGDVEITYNLYSGITYVANPVDADYQSLDVSVPVSIDGESVDASSSPILFNIAVGGYTSVRNKTSSSSASPTESATADPSATASADPSASAEEPTADPSASGVVPTGEFPGGDMPGGGTGNSDLALAAGYVVISPGCRGRDNVSSDGTYYGKAPAAIVDLKAAVRYVRSNKGVIPGNTDRIVSTGGSAGGALSALLGASGGSALYQPYLDDLGAANASDSIFAVASYCPIADLEHSDMSYEWMFGTQETNSGLVDQTLSAELSAAFTDYQSSLNLTGRDDFGALTADNYGDYLVQAFLQPAATTYLADLSDDDLTSYLAENTWITWDGDAATFAFSDFLTHVGRSKSLPAFDSFTLSQAENILFGDETTDARHFTEFSLRYTSGDDTATIDEDLPEKINMMNPMYFVGERNAKRSKQWWFRVGTNDTDTSLTVLSNLVTGLENLGDQVDSLMYWEAGHGANEDAEDFIVWMGDITGQAPRRGRK